MSFPRAFVRAGLLGLALMLGTPLLGQVAPPEKQPDKEQPAPAPTLPDTWTKALQWRPVGPANMSGRIVALAVNPNDPSNYWVATASGGLLKTTNNGVTFEHQFDREATVSIGDVAVSASDPKVLYVGTGENNPRNSVSYGDGVYKSTDGGKTWVNVGLKKSFQIGRIVIHPKNPDIVYVGALGRLYGPSEERGLYKTVDGGKTWDRILFVDDRTGVIEMQMNPAEPDTLLVATWERKRDGFDFNDPEVKWGAGSGLHKTTDGGKSWKKITEGLPTNKLGRIGLSYYGKDPKVVYAIVDCEKIGMGPKGAGGGGGTAYMGVTGEDGPNGAKLKSVVKEGPADKAGLMIGDIVTKLGEQEIKDYEALIGFNREKKAGDKIDVSYERDGKPGKASLTYAERPGGGGQPGTKGGDPNRPFGANLGGQRENVTTQGADAHEYGGVYRSDNGGDTWKRVNSVNPRPMYFSCIRVDPSDDRYVYVTGVSMYRSSDGGKNFRGDVKGIHADHHALWIDPRDGRHMIVGTDGGFYSTYDRTENWDHHNTTAIGQFYHVAIDPRPRYAVYGGLQDNGSWGGPTRTRTFTGPVNEDWLSVGGGDGFRCAVDQTDPDLVYWESQNGGLARRNLRTGEAASIRPQEKGVRWNWNTPFALSHFNQKIYYAAGNMLFKSLDKGTDLKAISPDLTRTKKGSASAFSESPKNADVLWVGTDDGNLWVTRNGGKDWTDVTAKVGLPGPRWVGSIEASRAAEGRAYVVFDGHRSDDDSAYVYVTEDYGQTWKSLRANLPNWTTRVCREDLFNPDVLYLGTEFAVFASIDRGGSWTKINNNLPTVAVHDFAQHPTTGEIVAATHGRSIWILDVSALRQVNAEKVKASGSLYQPVTAYRWVNEPAHGRTNRRFAGENPPNGASLYYSLGTGVEKVSLKVVDAQGKQVRDLQASKTPGLHRVQLPLLGGGGGRPGGPMGGGGQGGIQPGTYRVVLTVDGKEESVPLKIEKDPYAAPNAIPTEMEEEEDDDEDTVID
jgi:photosystem II stability/assembly factor-like uncharacterized protein